MAANRNPPTLSNTPGGIGGSSYATRISEELVALYKGRVNQITSVGGTANAITGVTSPPLIAAPQHGETFRLTPTADNTTAVTINVDGQGALDLVTEDGVALSAGDVKSNRPILFWYDSVSGDFRLTTATTATIAAELADEIAAANRWDLIAQDTVGGSVATKEYSWAAQTYSFIKFMGFGISSGNNTVNMAITLRHSGGAILTHTTSSTVNNSETHSFNADYYIPKTTSKIYLGEIITYLSATTAAQAVQGVLNANDADRVRVAFSAGNIDAGTFYVYGLRFP